MLDEAHRILKKTFGYSEFRLQQEQIIEKICCGEDALVLMPTGGGKSLCYQLPSLIRDGVGIVISPLIALMQDQVDAMQQLGVRAAFLNSSLDSRSQHEVSSRYLNQQLDLLYIAPERLLSESCLQLLSRGKIALFAIDEAHCVSQWGHDFRPEYQRLKILHERFPDCPRIALTATADKRTQNEIIHQLNLHDASVFLTSFNRPNIRYSINESSNPKEALWKFLEREHPKDAGIVYCLSRKKVEATAEWLSTKGRKALPYHAGLNAKIRQSNQQRFLREDNIIIVATIAFGMGIDKPDVRFVAHLNLPKNIEAYYQETGRAGRDGEAANAWMMYGLQDVIMLRQMLEESNAAEEHKRVVYSKLQSMLGLCELSSCRRQALLGYFDEHMNAPCGNCDNCITPPETWDATEAVRMALSCVYRSGQRFGVNHLIDILRGSKNERIHQLGHQNLSTYNIGGEFSTNDWRSIFRQIIARGLLDIDFEGFGTLKLNASCKELLAGKQTITFRRLRKEKANATKAKSKISQSISTPDNPLWEALRELRKNLATQNNVPPYVIFHDKTLLSMVTSKPTQLSSFAKIPGVGDVKLEAYGADFIDLIKEYA